jgi:hypothetical protein
VRVSGARDDTATTDPGTPVDVDVRANDPCTSCTLTATTSPAAGTVTVTGDGRLRYAPRPGFSGLDHLGYTLSLDGATTSATVSVAVRPRAVDDAGTTSVDSPLELRVLDNDLCGACAVTSVGAASAGAVSVVPGGALVRYTPSPGWDGTAHATYTLTDRAGSTSSATLVVRVVSPPALTDDTATTDAGVPVELPVLANDTCPDCTVEVAQDPLAGSVSLAASGALRYAPAPGTSGRFVLRYRATDPVTGGSATALATVDVRPRALDDAAWTAVGRPVAVPVLANDACTGCATQVVSTTHDATASFAGGELTVTPAAGWTGPVTVTYRLTDPATGLAATAQVAVDVNDARPDSATTPRQVPVTVDVVANDACPACVVQQVDGPAIASGRDVSYPSPADAAGLVVLGYTAGTEGTPGITTTLRLLVTPPERTTTLPPGGTTTGSVHAATTAIHATPATPPTTCADCVVSLVRPPADGELELRADGAFDYTAAPGATADDAFRYLLTDPVSGRSVEAEHRIVLGEVAPPPPPGDTGPTDPPAAPGLGLVTTAGAVDGAVAGPADRHDAGDTVPLRHVVTNTGGHELTDLAVTADRGTAVTCPPGALAVGEERTCTSSAALTQADVDAGHLAVATGATGSGDGRTASASGSTDVPVTRVSSLQVTAATTVLDLSPVEPGDGAEAGDTATTTWTLTDDGNTTLTAVTLDGATCTPLTLAPGQTATCYRTTTLTADHVDAGELVEPGEVAASSSGGPVAASAPVRTALPTATALPPGDTPTDPAPVPVTALALVSSASVDTAPVAPVSRVDAG